MGGESEPAQLPATVQFGRSLVCVGACLGIGIAGLLRLVFPDPDSLGLVWRQLSFACPIVLVSGAGLGFVTAGWLEDPRRFRRWTPELPESKVASRRLSTLVLALGLLLASVMFVVDPGREASALRLAAWGYVGTVTLFATFYVFVLYLDGRHAVAATYLSCFSQGGILLLPITWPLLVWFAGDSPRDDPAESN